MIDLLKNTFLYRDKYKTHGEAIIISCFFNPQKSPYRIKAFKTFYESIKHLNHHIVECVVGDSKPELTNIVPEGNRKTIYTKNLLWHKEALLNRAILTLPEKYKYVFWIDADVIFTNKNWMPEAVKSLQENNIVQLFEYCVHLDKDQLKPEFNLEFAKAMYDPKKGLVKESKRLWKSFGANWAQKTKEAKSDNYDEHGHVGFAWGARRSILIDVPLYDKALIGGADHIIAHAAVGQIPHSCITKSFKDNLDEVKLWSLSFFMAVQGKIGYVKGDVYHIWHGDISKRNYLKRIIDFTPKTKTITKRDENGLYITDDVDVLDYMVDYFMYREVVDSDSPFYSEENIPIQEENNFEFGGGQSGGAGSGGSYDVDQVVVNDTVADIVDIVNDVVILDENMLGDSQDNINTDNTEYNDSQDNLSADTTDDNENFS